MYEWIIQPGAIDFTLRGHGGTLELVETSGAGTTFRIFLPKGGE